jgi:hypothetical protein
MMDLKGVAEFRDGVNGHSNPYENILYSREGTSGVGQILESCETSVLSIKAKCPFQGTNDIYHAPGLRKVLVGAGAMRGR